MIFLIGGIMKENNKKKQIYLVTAILGIFLGVIIISSIFLFNSDSKKTEKSLKLGQKYLSDGEYSEAIAEFEKVLEIDELNADAYLGIAKCYAEDDDYEEACEILEEAIELFEDEGMDNAKEYKKLKKQYDKYQDKLVVEEDTPPIEEEEYLEPEHVEEMESVENPVQEEEEIAYNGELIKVGLLGDQMFRDYVDDFRDVFCEKNGYDFELTCGSLDIQTEMTLVSRYYEMGIEYIIIHRMIEPYNAGEIEYWEEMAQRAQINGKEVIFVGHEIDLNPSYFLAIINVDQYENSASYVHEIIMEHQAGR